jgi:predicted HTH domain antitoxin
MDIITKKDEISNNFLLHFFINGDGSEFLDYDLPFPNYHKHYTGKGYAIAWLIEGFFGTKKGNEYLNDAIARFLITFKEYEPKRLPYKPDERTNKILQHTYKLKEISSKLESIKTHRKAPTRADSFADSVFWAIKLYAEDEIRLTGFIVYSRLEDWALMMFIEHKERSTIKAKCRSVWNYYEERDFKLSTYKRKLTDEEYLMTRKEKVKELQENKLKESEAKIRGAIESLKFMQEKISVTNVAKYAGVSRPTVYKFKHLLEE